MVSPQSISTAPSLFARAFPIRVASLASPRSAGRLLK
jgi:hypothetical protein